MKSNRFYILLLLVFIASTVSSQTKEELEKGVSFIESETYSQEDNLKLLKLYEDLRVADVSDGMDKVG
ncbi:MAG TPA: hypothetical protein VKA10_08380, partial [Prolixibacteraceae bacterium]|nr:hypothetical protein [Prolixibacteraceae bacterium]